MDIFFLDIDYLKSKSNKPFIIFVDSGGFRIRKEGGQVSFKDNNIIFDGGIIKVKDVLKKHKFDALIMSIRRDEHYMRNLERYYSPRDKKFKWHLVRPKTKSELKEGDAPFVSEQQVEFAGWNLFQTDFGKNCHHVRVHPILHWNELDIWEYIKEKKLPINPLYYSKNGYRYRSLGCMPCTVPIKSNAKTIDDIIEELKTTTIEERAGRSQDKEKEQMMRRLRAMGYM